MSDGESTKQTNFLFFTINLKGFDMSLSTIIKKVVLIDNNEEELSEFQKHMKFNITLMNFIRVKIKN